jgi:hypothetical protein
MPDDPLRGTGRTTALMFHAIANALEDPDQWVEFHDHRACCATRDRRHLERIQHICRHMNIHMDVGQSPKGVVMLRSPIARIRAERSKGGAA